MIWPANSLRLRLLAALLAVWALGIVAMAVQFAAHEGQPDEILEDASLSTQARALLGGMRFDPAGHLATLRISRSWQRAYHTAEAAYFTLYDAKGHAVARSPNLVAPLAKIPLTPGEDFSPQMLSGSKQDLTEGARAPNGYELVVARANPGRADQTDAQKWADRVPGLMFVFFALAGLLAVWLVAAWGLRPLARAAEEAAGINPEHPDARLTLPSLPGEMRPLAQAVNQALDRVSEAYANEKRFTAEAAHALRTPLAVLDLRLQRAEQGGQTDWPAVRADLAELARVVSSLLALSRADRSRQFRTSAPVNLTRLVREVAAAFAPRLDEDGRLIEVFSPDQPINLRGDAAELREMVFALIDNALTHGRGAVRLSLKRERGQVALCVSDDGQGVAEEARETVFERFHKLAATSPGAGLGLAIVRQTARSHGGEARFAGPASVEVRLGTG